jgi:mannosyltransferase OCH1-like enzyme
MKTFDLCMGNSSNFLNPKLLEKWDIFQKLYNTPLTNQQQKIPKIIHQIWLGGDLPADLLSCIESIKKSNPGYIHKLWLDKDVEDFDFKNKTLFLSTPNFGQKSDILRYAVLEQYGGIYLDTDFIGCKSFDSLLQYNFFAGISYDREPRLFNGLFGTSSNNILIKRLNDIKNLRYQEGMDVIETTGPYFLTECFFECCNNMNDIVALPVSYFYPYPNFNHDKNRGNNYQDYIEPETICTHLWHSRWN